MTQQLIEQASAIIRAAGASVLSMIALVILVLAYFTALLIGRAAPLKIRLGVFLLMFVALAALAGDLLRLFPPHPGPTPGPTPGPSSICQPDLASIASQDPAQLTIRNQSSEPINVFWVDTRGCEIVEGTINPHDSQVWNTYMTHVWLIKSEHGSPLKLYIATSGQQEVVYQ